MVDHLLFYGRSRRLLLQIAHHDYTWTDPVSTSRHVGRPVSCIQSQAVPPASQITKITGCPFSRGSIAQITHYRCALCRSLLIASVTNNVFTTYPLQMHPFAQITKNGCVFSQGKAFHRSHIPESPITGVHFLTGRHCTDHTFEGHQFQACLFSRGGISHITHCGYALCRSLPTA